MKKIFIALAAVIAAAALHPAWAEDGKDRIYRCGNEYTNDAAQAKERGCKLVENANVTILQSQPRPAASAGSAAPPPNTPRVTPASQSARDTEARAILQDELRKAETKLADLRNEYNDGSPQRTALELRNPQGYIERTAELKANVDRAQSDVDAIKRELARSGGGN